VARCLYTFEWTAAIVAAYYRRKGSIPPRGWTSFSCGSSPGEDEPDRITRSGTSPRERTGLAGLSGEAGSGESASPLGEMDRDLYQVKTGP